MLRFQNKIYTTLPGKNTLFLIISIFYTIKTSCLDFQEGCSEVDKDCIFSTDFSLQLSF